MQEGPKVTIPAPDPENMKEVLKQDKFMKQVYQNELGDTFQSFSDGVAIGEIRTTPLAPMSPFESGPWPDKGE